MQVEIAGNEYLVNRLHIKVAVNVARKFGPAIISAAPAALDSLSKGQTPPLEDMVRALVPAIHGLAAMTNEDSDYIVDRCMEVVRIKRGNSFQPFWNAAAGSPQYDDGSLTLALVGQLVFYVIQESKLLDFFPGNSPASPAPGTPSVSSSPPIPTATTGSGVPFNTGT